MNGGGEGGPACLVLVSMQSRSIFRYNDDHQGKVVLYGVAASRNIGPDGMI